MFPKVNNYGDIDVEDFQSYYARFPKELKSIPIDVVENWIYRHWDDFTEWIPLKPQDWKYELKEFSNNEILKISHINDWIPILKAEAVEYVTRGKRVNNYVGQYMLKNGTTPSPIIVGENIGHISYPRMPITCLMKEPYQLIEGHSRLACLLGMISSSHINLKKYHKV